MSLAAKESTELQYFTVIGVGRSGTSLLMTALDSHRQLSLPPETQFVWRHVLRWPRASLEETRARLQTETNFARLGIGIDQLLAPFLSVNVPFSNANVYRRIIELWSHTSGLSRVGDKSPKNIECLPILRHIFPQARVIHLIRDPRDVFLSRTRAAWCSHRPPLLQTLAYRSQLDLARHLGPRLFGENYLEVYYEAILAEPQRELGRICEFLGVRFDAGMLDRQQSAETHVFAEELDWKREVLGPLMPDNYDKWRTELTPEEVAYVEDSCVTSFRGGRYVPSQAARSWAGGLRGAWIRTRMKLLSTAYQAWLGHRNRRAIRAIASAERAASRHSHLSPRSSQPTSSVASNAA